MSRLHGRGRRNRLRHARSPQRNNANIACCRNVPCIGPHAVHQAMVGDDVFPEPNELFARGSEVRMFPKRCASPFQAIPSGFPGRTGACLRQPKPSLPKCLRCHRRRRNPSRHRNGSAQRALSAPGWRRRIRVAVKQVKPHRHVLVRNAQPGIDIRVRPSNRLLPAPDPSIALGRGFPVLRRRHLCRARSHKPHIGRASRRRQPDPKPRGSSADGTQSACCPC